MEGGGAGGEGGRSQLGTPQRKAVDARPEDGQVPSMYDSFHSQAAHLDPLLITLHPTLILPEDLNI